MEKKKIKIFVGMSGGVDSSTTAALLCKNKNYDVHGVFIKGWPTSAKASAGKYPQIKNIPCTWREDRRDAMRVAAKLDIPFYTFDFSKEYKKHIIDYMIEEYRRGNTPNPDIMCNKYIKFDLFLKKALEMGADKISTGHYVQLIKTQNTNHKLQTKSKIQNSNYKLQTATDESKDQSYFLWTLGQEQLKHCLFPVGGYLKEDVRKMAKKFKLPVFDKKDSQGLCFVGEFKMEDFLKDFIKPKLGKILNEKGEIIGEHKGVEYYTIGQRHGTGAKGEQPLYIVAKDLEKNTLTAVSEDKEKDFYKKEVEIKDVNWTIGEMPKRNAMSFRARIRYRQPLQKCQIYVKNKKIKVIFDKAQRAIAPGQSLVLYKGDELLGGGIIV